jgi:hypothetical protein
LYLFYGGDIRTYELPWFRTQIEQLAVMPPVDDDNDWPRGLFVVTAEEVEEAETWHVREGTVTAVPAPGLSWLGE